MEPVIVEQLLKTYGPEKTPAVKEVSFSVKAGELFGLIGPDGAGKTSIFRMLSTLLLPDAGSARIHGLDIVKDYRAIRQILGYMPGKFSLYQDLTVEENLNFFATLFNTSVKENYALIKDIYVQIEPFKERRAGKLSGGMKQKLALSCALIHRPKVLFLDEPTTGVDAVSRREFWDMIKSLQAQGISILVSTPYMDEAGLCDRIALIQSGEILQVNSPQQIMLDYPYPLFALRSAEMIRLLRDLETYEGTRSCFAFGEYLHLSFKTYTETSVTELLQYLQNLGHRNTLCQQIQAGIEDCFIQLMKKAA